MKRLYASIQAITLVALLCSTAFAGNIGGMRTEASTSLKSTGNIGGMRSEDLYTGIVVTIAGNIGGMLTATTTIP
jgi:hypothetical protein